MASQPSSFSSVKDLKFVITLVTPGATFSGTGDNTIILRGLRASVTVDNAGDAAIMGRLHAQIFGLTASDANSLTSVLWNVPATGENTIQVYAIDGSQETLVFLGQILQCWGVYESMPESYVMIEACSGYNQLVQSAPPTSVQADTTVATIMQQLASQMGFQFDNSAGVNITVKKGTYLGGTAMEQVRNLARAYRFWVYLDNTSPNTLAITPYGKGRQLQVVPVISPETGMIGYPAFNGSGVTLSTLFNPGIVFGGNISVKSAIPKANGTWTVVSMTHNLTSQMPGGPWRTDLQATSATLYQQVQP